MAVEKIRGIVLKEINKGETSKNLIVLSKGIGKIFMYARGARKSKSPLMASSQIFSYCDFVAFENKNFYNINQAEIIDNFYNIRTDIEKLAYSSYILELVEKTCPENMECDNIMLLLLKTLSVMSKTDINPRFITRVFEIKYMSLMGFMPETENCVFCGNDSHLNYFSKIEGGVMCDDCKKKGIDGGIISNGALQSLRYILKSDVSKVFNFRVSDDVLYELSILSKDYISSHINMKFKTLDFAESL
ncbi:DNA repair protein RecO [Tyzzerella sp. An114]|uniref:DNA repair protein RecO n=1 Tax=Tyzzerella sp. An114 TaxID=1965545 RepID=UPI000B432736|nr:DNA repair protein RecO [Tyzzerella sp. An114]OUQ57449.1 DNA repair protein RecO [Tyzzerella sp. An114]